LNKEKREDVFLPVMIDNTTGIGIYIIGREWYSGNQSMYKKIKDSCIFGFVQFDKIILTKLWTSVIILLMTYDQNLD
jgi:hypothetical protein